jgi:hypothetical protein
MCEVLSTQHVGDDMAIIPNHVSGQAEKSPVLKNQAQAQPGQISTKPVGCGRVVVFNGVFRLPSPVRMPGQHF